MQSRPIKLTFKFEVKRVENGFNGSTLPDHLDKSPQQPVELVVYDPAARGTTTGEDYQPLSFLKIYISTPFHSSKESPSVGAFTVQCAECFKRRLIPTKEKYEEIREHLKYHVKTEDPPDICQDGSRLWVIDKPNIAQPPPGWQL